MHYLLHGTSWICVFCTFKKSNKMHFDDLIIQIKSRRAELNITQETLSEISGVGLRTIKEFESGKGNPTLLTMQKIGNALGLKLTFQIQLNNLLK
jgi:transcriptional regulator with XRE-family HTH domain